MDEPLPADLNLWVCALKALLPQQAAISVGAVVPAAGLPARSLPGVAIGDAGADQSGIDTFLASGNARLVLTAAFHRVGGCRLCREPGQHDHCGCHNDEFATHAVWLARLASGRLAGLPRAAK